MTEIVLGVDTGLRRTGLAVVTHDYGSVEAHTWLIATTQPRADTIGYRVGRLGQLVRGVRAVLGELPGRTLLAAMEAPSFGSRKTDAHYHDSAGAWWVIACALEGAGVPIAGVAPMTRAKWATGSGAADKAAVRAAMGEHWPTAGCAALGSTRYDEADALALATMAAQHLGWPVHHEPHQRTSLDVVRWPAPLAGAL